VCCRSRATGLVAGHGANVIFRISSYLLERPRRKQLALMARRRRTPKGMPIGVPFLLTPATTRDTSHPPPHPYQLPSTVLTPGGQLMPRYGNRPGICVVAVVLADGYSASLPFFKGCPLLLSMDCPLPLEAYLALRHIQLHQRMLRQTSCHLLRVPSP